MNLCLTQFCRLIWPGKLHYLISGRDPSSQPAREGSSSLTTQIITLTSSSSFLKFWKGGETWMFPSTSTTISTMRCDEDETCVQTILTVKFLKVSLARNNPSYQPWKPNCQMTPNSEDIILGGISLRDFADSVNR